VKIKLDENMPDRLVSILTELAHDVDTVRGEQLTGRADSDVWSAAQAAERFLITQDLDFRMFAAIQPALTRPSSCAPDATRPQRLVRARIDIVPDGETEEWTGCLVVATEQKIRIRRPE
jgi:hypothetical protein